MVKLRGEQSKSYEKEIVVAKDGTPYKTTQVAALQQSRMRLQATHNIVEYEGGYALMPVDPAGVKSTKTGTDGKKADEEKYWRVRFHPMSDKNQHKSVILACNNEVLHMQRDEIVTIPQRFREIADNSVETRYSHEPGRDRQEIGHIKTYPYDVIEESTKEEFETQKRQGNEQTEEARKVARVG